MHTLPQDVHFWLEKTGLQNLELWDFKGFVGFSLLNLSGRCRLGNSPLNVHWIEFLPLSVAWTEGKREQKQCYNSFVTSLDPFWLYLPLHLLVFTQLFCFLHAWKTSMLMPPSCLWSCFSNCISNSTQSLDAGPGEKFGCRDFQKHD